MEAAFEGRFLKRKHDVFFLSDLTGCENRLSCCHRQKRSKVAKGV